MLARPEPAIAWCHQCRREVELVDLRPWPGGVLALGDCPECESTLAIQKPFGWPEEDGDEASSQPVPLRQASAQGDAESAA